VEKSGFLVLLGTKTEMNGRTKRFELIAFDADDTLWHNESLYNMTQDRFKELLAPYLDGEIVDQELYETEMRNLARYGYGIKSFTLSMIETAIELTDGRVGGAEIRHIIDFAHEMLAAPVRLIDGIEDVLAALGADYRLMVITKGDLFDQETKLARSGLDGYFDLVEIVSNKRPETYAGLLARHDVAADRFLMVGNSLPSDILPVLEIGGHGVHIPYHITWAHEVVDETEVPDERYATLQDVRQLPALLARGLL
jgi:putative hydrolase of the HAD superfamily